MALYAGLAEDLGLDVDGAGGPVGSEVELRRAGASCGRLRRRGHWVAPLDRAATRAALGMPCGGGRRDGCPDHPD